MNKDAEYDSSLGGSQDLPDEINILKFSAARSKEIHVMKQTLKSSRCVKLAFQKLPKHMRRRVMSHNAKRLPRKLREIHMHQLAKSGMPPKQKRPSRKYRRRPRNLMEDYARRQRNNIWLETHIWHAKRFHMVNKWGYRLADRPCDKSFRACYRATSKHCLVQDISYFSCIELCGCKDVLVTSLKQICNPNEGLSVGAKAFADGKREGVTTFYNTSRKKAIGEVRFHWKPKITESEDYVIWIWAHAAYYAEVLHALIDLFRLEKVDLMDDESSRADLYQNNETNVKLLNLKNLLNRFRLTGPLSQAVLSKALQPVELLNNNSEWLQKFLENDEYRQIFAEQLDVWKEFIKYNSPSLMPPHMVFSLIVADPRYSFPSKRTKAVPDDHTVVELNIQVPQQVSFGPIWDSVVRNKVKQSKIPNSAIAEMRSQLLVPGSALDQPGLPVAVILIQRPGLARSGYGSGWDLIIPSGWAQPFWLGLTMWGARAGGLRETDHLDFELGKHTLLLPDTDAGQAEDDQKSSTQVEKYFRLPPNKRTNYNKFSVATPFKCDWKSLCSNWNESSRSDEDFFVIRDKHLLLDINSALQGRNKKTILDNEVLNENCLVPVRLAVNKGIFRRYSLICIPAAGDLKIPPKESLVPDKNQNKRKLLRISHKTLLKRLRKKRIAAKKLGKKIDVDLEMLKDYQKQMRDLWMPAAENIKESSSRSVVGYVVAGDFSFRSSQSQALGYVVGRALKMLLLQSSSNKVLLRRTNCRQYRIAKLEIVIN